MGWFFAFFFLSEPIPLAVAAGGTLILVGAVIPASWQLEFVVPLCFLALLAPLLHERIALIVFATAAVAAVALDAMPMRLSMICAGLVGIVAGVVVSSRVNDPRVAQQIGGIVVIPIIAVTLVQATGTLLVGASGYLLMTVIVLIVSLLGLRVGVALFDREAILTRWR